VAGVAVMVAGLQARRRVHGRSQMLSRGWPGRGAAPLVRRGGAHAAGRPCPSPVDLSHQAGPDVLWLKLEGRGAGVSCHSTRAKFARLADEDRGVPLSGWAR
jgi:hypothetical protein